MGSSLIGQPFDDPKYFWSRPSATSPYPYNGAASSGSNQGPRNPALEDAVKNRIKALRDADPGNTAPVPVDLVTASGSGLDPHISVAAADFQVPRVAKARGLTDGRGTRARRAKHRGTHARRPRRAARQRACAQPRTRPRAALRRRGRMGRAATPTVPFAFALPVAKRLDEREIARARLLHWQLKT